ncbi:VanZ family protein [Christensenellaceae bacterium OttesenSCG-928-K19]|nr:VanZ family protein [Christensenellaceae bacterium OttesenSCG-928-K19]
MEHKNHIIIKNLLLVGFILYIALLLWVVVFKYVAPWELFSEGRYFSRTVNFIPFGGVLTQTDIVGNLLLFIPMGIYLRAFLSGKKAYMSIVYAFFVSVIFEAVQYGFGIGAADVTDLIMNTAGAALGVGVCLVLERLFKGPQKVRALVAIIGMAVMAIGMVISVLLVIMN